jgi:hypothetical protein
MEVLTITSISVSPSFGKSKGSEKQQATTADILKCSKLLSRSCDQLNLGWYSKTTRSGVETV